jgi:hypothetical protein
MEFDALYSLENKPNNNDRSCRLAGKVYYVTDIDAHRVHYNSEDGLNPWTNIKGKGKSFIPLKKVKDTELARFMYDKVYKEVDGCIYVEAE